MSWPSSRSAAHAGRGVPVGAGRAPRGGRPRLRVQRRDAWQLVTAPEVGARLAACAAARGAPLARRARGAGGRRIPPAVHPRDVERVRGVDSDYVIRSLLHRRLIVELGRDTPGAPVLFGTTFTFLERFGLTSLDDLPPLSSDAAQLGLVGHRWP